VSHASRADQVNLRCSAGRNKFRRYTDTEFDFIIGYDFYSDTAYVFSRQECEGKKNVITTRASAAEQWGKILGA
jgi:hypothetical protein